jgi:hypothetical protein
MGTFLKGDIKAWIRPLPYSTYASSIYAEGPHNWDQIDWRPPSLLSRHQVLGGSTADLLSVDTENNNCNPACPALIKKKSKDLITS